MKRYLKGLVISVLVVLLAVVPVGASGSQQAAEELDHLLQRVSSVISYLVSLDYIVEHLELHTLMLDREYVLQQPMFKGLEYQVVAIGGPGLFNLDLYLYDSDGELLTYDAEVGDVMVVEYNPSVTAPYHLNVHAVELEEGWTESSVCYFMVLVAAKSQATVKK